MTFPQYSPLGIAPARITSCYLIIFRGLALGAAMILPWSTKCVRDEPGIRRQYHLMIALPCAVSDLLLICRVWRQSALLRQSPWLLALVTGAA